MRLRLLPVALAASLALPSLASADRFYFGSAEAEAKMTEGSADYVEGVLIGEDNATYTIRVLGGEITVAKDMVYKIEKDGLTVAQIEEREAARRDQLAAANVRRREIQAVEAAATRQAHEQRAEPEPSRTTIVIDFQGLLPGYTFTAFDPVLDRVSLAGLQAVIRRYLRAEVYRAAHRDPTEAGWRQ